MNLLKYEREFVGNCSCVFKLETKQNTAGILVWIKI